MCRNRSKIDLCGPKNDCDHGDDISYFVTYDFTDLYKNQYAYMTIWDQCQYVGVDPWEDLRTTALLSVLRSLLDSM